MSEIKKIKYERLEGYEVKRDDNEVLDIFASIFTLKNIIRTGWVKYHGIKKEVAESVADHSFSTTVLAYLFAKKWRQDLDADKVLKMTLFHEFAEVYAGDIPMRDFPDLDEKRKLERDSFEQVFLKFGNLGNEIFNLWEEMEDEKTPEAKFVVQFDKFEAVLQAYLYKKEGAGMVDYLSFIELSEGKFFDKEILDLIKRLKQKSG